jgi:hypothetical protein
MTFETDSKMAVDVCLVTDFSHHSG